MAGFLNRGLKQILQKSPHDVVILSALRTPLTRANKGGLKDAYPEELLSAVLKATLAKNPNVDPRAIQDVCVGSVLQELGGAKAGRMAAIHAGLPSSTAFYTINRQCSSGLAAITSIAHQIAVGAMDVGIGAGMESMTRNYGSRAIPTVLWPELRDSPAKDARDCIMPMGLTSENVAQRYEISRSDQDAFAVQSHQKAAKAQSEGLFDQELVPVGEVTADDGVRADSSLEKLAKLKPAFKPDGTSTAGNSSQITDGAAAVLMMRRCTAERLGVAGSAVAKWAGTQVAGCAPDEMGVGPAAAIPKLLAHAEISQDAVQAWEINEAFASQALYCVRRLGIDERLVNRKGGAIALGHPLGATGARQVATLLPEMERLGLELGVVSMCIGTGMGMASLFIRE